MSALPSCRKEDAGRSTTTTTVTTTSVQVLTTTLRDMKLPAQTRPADHASTPTDDTDDLGEHSGLLLSTATRPYIAEDSCCRGPPTENSTPIFAFAVPAPEAAAAGAPLYSSSDVHVGMMPRYIVAPPFHGMGLTFGLDESSTTATASLGATSASHACGVTTTTLGCPSTGPSVATSLGSPSAALGLPHGGTPTHPSSCWVYSVDGTHEEGTRARAGETRWIGTPALPPRTSAYQRFERAVQGSGLTSCVVGKAAQYREEAMMAAARLMASTS